MMVILKAIKPCALNGNIHGVPGSMVTDLQQGKVRDMEFR